MAGGENLFDRFSDIEVFDSPDLLRDHYTPDKVENRDDEIRKLFVKLKPAMSGDRTGHALLEGPNGTGKTVVSKYVAKEFVESDQIDNGAFVDVNCGTVESEYEMAVRITNNINPPDEQISERGHSTDRVVKSACEAIESLGDSVILILDEVGGVEKMNDFLYHLSRSKQGGTYFNDADVSVIFTGNSLPFVDNLNQKTRSAFDDKDGIQFDPYHADELYDILATRANRAFHEIEDAAIRKAAGKAAKHGGDARYGLQMLLKAGEYALEKAEMPVTQSHIESGQQRVNRKRIKTRLSGFSTGDQGVLFALLKLASAGNTEPSGMDVINTYNAIRDSVGGYVFPDRGKQLIYETLRDLEEQELIERVDGPKATKINQLRYPTDRIAEQLDAQLLATLSDEGFVKNYDTDGQITVRPTQQ